MKPSLANVLSVARSLLFVVFLHRQDLVRRRGKEFALSALGLYRLNRALREPVSLRGQRQHTGRGRNEMKAVRYERIATRHWNVPISKK